MTDGQKRGAAVAGIVLLAVAARITGIDHRLTHDEGYTWLVGSSPSAGIFLHRLAAFENTPPLYYLLLTILPLNDEPWIRLPALLAGVALVPVLYAIAAPALGARVALLGALGLAVAPYAVANSDFARGFMLADLCLLLALWGLVRVAEGGPGRWWLLYGAGAVLAIYSEYDAVTTLVPLVVGMTLLVPAHRRLRTFALGAAPALAFAPWVHQLSRSLNALHITKVGGGYLTVTPGSIRDQLVTLSYGQNGQHAAAGVRTLAVMVLIAAVGFGAGAMQRRAAGAQVLLTLLAWAGLGTLILHALAPIADIGIFNVRYLTFLIPVVCILLAQATAAVPVRLAVPAAAVALAGVGVGVAIKRVGNDGEPDPRAVSRVLSAAGVRTVLTNSAVAAYYLRRQGVILDRPLNFGPDLEYDCGQCARPLAVLDDTSVGSGARPGPGIVTRVGHFVVRIAP